MIDRIITFSVRHRIVVIAAGLALAVWGLAAVATTPMDAIPDLSENQVIVFTDWPGHSPREIEDQVTYPLSLNLQGVAGVRVVRSSSDFNFSMINLIFEDDVAYSEARRRVAQRLTQAARDLPAGVVPTLGPEALATGQIFWYTVEGTGHDLGRLRAVQDWYVRPQLHAVPGVAEVASVGGFPIEYHVEIDPNRLRLKGVTLRAVVEAVAGSNAAVGGHVIEKGNAEYLVRSVGWLGEGEGGRFDPTRVIRDLEAVVVPKAEGGFVLVGDVARVVLGARPRRGVLEKGGSEVTGGVVLSRAGENPLEVTRRLKRKIRELQAGLPPGVWIVPFYDRTPLIEGAVGTVTGMLIEAIVTATICVSLVLLHLRTSLIIALTLPLAALASFAMMGALRWFGIVDIQMNIMSIAGIAISIGILVDSSIVVAENVMHRLKGHFGNRPARGDVRPIVLSACLTVGRPIFFSVVIMLLSFLPVFALGGLEGKMFRPLVFTKSFAMIAAAILAITLVPALCTIFIRGHLRGEMESGLVRGVVEVYRPVLNYLLDNPTALFWVLGVTFLVGLAPIGSRALLLGMLLIALVAVGWTTRKWGTRLSAMASLVLVGLVAERSIEPLGVEFLAPLDEGMVMDMPITVPRASVTESADDLKARDMILCRFPEVDMVVGKAGRAETPIDPAPMDMIETMVNFRPREFWPRRKLHQGDAERQGWAVLDALIQRGIIEPPSDAASKAKLVGEAVSAALGIFDAQMREYAYQRNQEFARDLGPVTQETLLDPHDPWTPHLRALWRQHASELDGELLDRAGPLYTRIVMDEILSRAKVLDSQLAASLASARRARARPVATTNAAPAVHHQGSRPTRLPALEPQPVLDALRDELAAPFAKRLMLWRIDRDALAGFGGELDRAVAMPGWTNVWTMPIQNRVDMLATGVNTAIGVRVLGRNLDDVVRASEAIAAVLKRLPGAADVVADPIRGKGYLEVRVHREKAARRGVSVRDINDVVETALGGQIVTTTVEGRERHPVRVRYARAWREDEESVRNLLVPSRGSPHPIPLSEVADVRIVEGPATIKSENGLLRNYVRLNVRGRGAVDFVADAKRAVAQHVKLPEGIYYEWTGQFEHEARARRTLAWIVPVVVALIFLVLYWTYHDLADAVLMLIVVPGAIAGGVFFQWLFGYKFSVMVWVGYIACFGMATSTGIIMLVYLREAVAQAGGLERLSLDGLRQAVMAGAVHRLRPKLLTEGTTVLSLAPMLWASGVGSEVIKPMAAPVLGGLLVADEVIDLFLPILFYWVRRWRWERIHGPGEDFATENAEIPEEETMRN
jgi:Cu(I)/Ag(I) efflux system membrane protein CusA/SilA